MYRQVSVQIRSSNGQVYSRLANLPFSIHDPDFLPTYAHKQEFETDLKYILKAQWNDRHIIQPNTNGALSLLNASFKMLNMKNTCVHLSSNTLRQGGMDYVPAEEGLIELPPELEHITSDIQELSVYSPALEYLPIWFGRMVNLKVLILDGGNNAGTGLNDVLEEFPRHWVGLIQLTHLTVKNYAKLRTISSEIFDLPCLESIIISCCVSLHFNESTIRGLCTARLRPLTVLSLNNTGDSVLQVLPYIPDLHHISLRWLPNLNVLPLSLRSLDNLRSVHLEYLPIKRLPSDMILFTRLNRLDISNCRFFEFEGTNLCMPTSLEILNLRFLPNVKELPSSVGSLTNIRKLMIERCNLEMIPKELCKLTNLTSLCLLHLLVQTYPICIEELVNLQSLQCTSKSLPSLTRDTMFGELAVALPSMLKLRSILFMSPNHDDVLSIGRSFKAWPLPLLDTYNLNFGFGEHWKILNLPKEAAQWNDHTIVQHWKIQQQKVLSFASGLHQRLGKTSWISVLDIGTVRYIADKICRYSEVNSKITCKCHDQIEYT